MVGWGSEAGLQGSEWLKQIRASNGGGGAEGDQEGGQYSAGTPRCLLSLSPPLFSPSLSSCSPTAPLYLHSSLVSQINDLTSSTPMSPGIK